MVGCAAPFCNNSAKKGYIMKVFPRDPERRALWQQNVPRENWTATNTSYLCEMHFSPEMWEQRCDGKRKLKPNAVPTIFGFFMKKKNTDTSRNEQISKEHAKEEQSNIEDLECNTIKNTAECISVNDIPESNIVDAVLSTTAENNTAECILTTSTSDTCISESENSNNEQLCKEKCNEVIKKAKLRMIIMQKKMKVMRLKLHSLEQKINNDKYMKALQRIFNEDQIAVLCTKSQQSKNWSNETVQRALKLKLACGTNGYEEVLRQGMPFPSLRTIQRRLEDFKFEPGISEKMFDFLAYKKSYFCKDTDVECGLVFDEMAITPRKSYDPSTETIVGDITFPNEPGIATHALVFMLVGIVNRWKHIVGYHLTGNSFNSKIAKEIIFQIIHKAEAVGFYVNFITSDMGSGNLGIWKLLGISSGKYSNTVNRIIHPCDINRYLYVIADPPHLLKNLKQALINNKVITISENTVHKYKLPTNKIYLKHFDELLTIQENSELLLTPRFKVSDIKCTNNFSKMRVNKAKNVFSNDVSSSFQLLAHERNKDDFYTTAWFVKLICKWFSLVTSRTCKLALGKKVENIYTENIEFLREVIDIFTELQIGNGEFKPVQRGIIITTTSILQLTDYLLEHRNVQFVLTSRFTQDAVENLFSQIRLKHVIPHPLQFIQDLKLISIAMYMKYIYSSSYDNDGGNYLQGFLEYLNKDKKNKNKTKRHNIMENNNNVINIDTLPPFNPYMIQLSNLELNSLYNIAGYIINSISRRCKICNKCLLSVGSKSKLSYHFTKLVQLKAYTENSLYFINKLTFGIFLRLEQMFRYYSKYFSDIGNTNIKSFLISKFRDVSANHILNCHQLYSKIIKRFVVLRLHIYQRKITIANRRYDSKSMAMHNIFS